MNTLEGKAWQALATSRGIGPKALWQIADYLFFHEKTASWILRNPDRAREALKNIRGHFVLPDPHVLGPGEGEGAVEDKVSVLYPLHPAFPVRLRELKEKLPLPALLYASGNLALLKKPAVAIVGSRDADSAALSVAERLAAELAAMGYTIASGYAAGIDSAAHAGALRAKGTTILVLAEGLGHFRLRAEIKGLLTDEKALVLSQFAPGEKWAAYQAMARNQLVAALAAALVVVVSGPERDARGRLSGSFAAGVSALKLGLPVLVAAPNSFPSPPAGNRELIRRGCRVWDPAAGIASILEAMKVPDKQKIPEQKRLF